MIETSFKNWHVQQSKLGKLGGGGGTFEGKALFIKKNGI